MWPSFFVWPLRVSPPRPRSLLAILDGRLQVVSRAEGEATVHDSEVFHAVSAMRSGVRYTLIMFFYELQPGAGSEEYRALPAS